MAKDTISVRDIDMNYDENFAIKIQNISDLYIWFTIDGENEIFKIRRPKHSEWNKFNELVFDKKLVSVRVLVAKKKYGAEEQYSRLSFVDMKIEYTNKEESDRIDRDSAKMIVGGLNRVQKEFLLSYIANDIMSEFTGMTGDIDA